MGEDYTLGDSKTSTGCQTAQRAGNNVARSCMTRYASASFIFDETLICDDIIISGCADVIAELKKKPAMKHVIPHRQSSQARADRDADLVTEMMTSQHSLRRGPSKPARNRLLILLLLTDTE